MHDGQWKLNLRRKKKGAKALEGQLEKITFSMTAKSIWAGARSLSWG